MKKSKEKVRDKFWDEKRPDCDLDMIELYLSLPEMDIMVREHGKTYLAQMTQDTAVLALLHRKHDKMMYKVFRAAAKVLTDKQWRIFVLRYKFGFNQVEIARQIESLQGYVSNTLQVCHNKIRVALRLQAKKRRVYLQRRASKKIKTNS